MPDTSFTDYVTTIVSTWLNQANKLVFWGRRPNVATTTGSANAQILTLETGSLYSAGTEADGDEFVFLAGFTNAAAMTLQVLQPSGTNVARAVQLNGAALTGGEVIAGQPYRVTRKSTTWQLTSLVGTAFGTTLLQQATAAATRAALGLNDGMATGSIVDAKGDIITATADNTPVRKAVGSNGQIIVADSTQSDGLIWTDFHREPINVNPNWLVDQIYEGTTATTTATAGGASTQVADGWTVYCINPSGAGNGAIRASVVTDPDFASRKALKIECTTADTTVSAGDLYQVYTAIEGYDVSSLNIGTANASQITVQFQFKSSKTGTYAIRLGNSAGNRSYVGTFTVSDTAVHDYSITLTLDTTGTWLYTNGIGLYVSITLMAGATFQTTSGSWQAGNFYATAAQANFMDSNTNVAYLGRFHVIPSNVVCAYKSSDIQRELAKCQRYYEKSYDIGTAPGAITTNGQYAAYLVTVASTAFSLPAVTYAVTKRAVPTVTTYSTQTGASGVVADITNGGDIAPAGNLSQGNHGHQTYVGTVGGNMQVYSHWVANARLS